MEREKLLNDWLITDYDREIFERDLENFVPPRVFDAHAHLYDIDHFDPSSDEKRLHSGPPIVSVDEYDNFNAEFMPGRSVDTLFFPMPTATVDIDATNEFTAKEVSKRAHSHGQMLISPAHDPEFVRETVRANGFVGLKPYHVFSSNIPTQDSAIEEFLTEQHVRVAHEERLTITLHIVRQRALADKQNQATIRRYATKYPDMRLILAHLARGFNPHHTIEGIVGLTGLSNVYFDTSATADPGASEAIVLSMGHNTLLFGSDFPISYQRGRPIALGDDFTWLRPQNLPIGGGKGGDATTAYAVSGGQPRQTINGIESLRSLKVGSMSLKLTDSQIEDIFYNNAARLLGI